MRYVGNAGILIGGAVITAEGSQDIKRLNSHQGVIGIFVKSKIWQSILVTFNRPSQPISIILFYLGYPTEIWILQANEAK
jgi:hypothetical protein